MTLKDSELRRRARKLGFSLHSARYEFLQALYGASWHADSRIYLLVDIARGVIVAGVECVAGVGGKAFTLTADEVDSWLRERE